MRFSILTLCLHLLASLHAAEPRDTMPDTWAATDTLVQLKTCGMCLSGSTTWESVEQKGAMIGVDLM